MTAASIERRVQIRQWLTILLFIMLLGGSVMATDASLVDLLQNTDQMFMFLEKFLHPDWSYAPFILKPLLETVQMAFVGTLTGAVLAFPAAFLATTFVTGSKWLTMMVRGLLNMIRTIPELLLAVLFVAIAGIGSFSGVLALTVFTFGMVSKLFYEAIETIDKGPIEAMTAAGASKIQIITFAVMPQIMSHVTSYVMYAFEINVRASAILGYIGAGGIGLFLQRALSQLRYDRVSMIIITIFAVVICMDIINEQIRKRWL